MLAARCVKSGTPNDHSKYPRKNDTLYRTGEDHPVVKVYISYNTHVHSLYSTWHKHFNILSQVLRVGTCFFNANVNK